jgi:hypothetical protein
MRVERYAGWANAIFIIIIYLVCMLWVGEVQRLYGVSAVVSQRMRLPMSYAQSFEKAEVSTPYILRTANRNG